MLVLEDGIVIFKVEADFLVVDVLAIPRDVVRGEGELEHFTGSPYANKVLQYELNDHKPRRSQPVLHCSGQIVCFDLHPFWEDRVPVSMVKPLPAVQYYAQLGTECTGSHKRFHRGGCMRHIYTYTLP